MTHITVWRWSVWTKHFTCFFLTFHQVFLKSIESLKINASYIIPYNLSETIVALNNKTEDLLADPEQFTAPTFSNMRESEIREYLNSKLQKQSQDEAQQIVREMMQRCIAIGQESH